MNEELISQEGYFNFVKEFKKLLEVEKPYWVKEKEIAAQLGDRSENAEYISAKEMIRNIDKRLRFLDKIIKNSKPVIIEELNHDKVNFGSQVKLLDLNQEIEKVFILLGTYETNPSNNIISIKSPFGKAIFGKELEEEFIFEINGNSFEYEIIEIKKYEFE